MLAVTKSSRPSTRMGRRSTSRIFSATGVTSRARSRPGSTRVNSSPPRRATVSPSRTHETMRSATFSRTRSPTVWPRESLMSLKPVVEEQPVGQSGQGVVVGQGAHALVAALAVGDVEGHAQGGAAAAELDEAAREVEPALLSALGEDLELVAPRHLLAPLPGEAALLHEAPEVGVHEVGEAQAQELVLGVAGKVGGGGIHEAELAALIDEDRTRGRFRQGPEARLALAQGIAGPHALERARHVTRDEGEDVEIGLREPHALVVALHHEHAE